jgi:hypothetical protein
MTLSDLERLLHATLTDQGGLMSVSVTEMPQQEANIHALIGKALEVARIKSIPLVSVELPLGLYSGLEADYADLQLRDCGGQDVLRFVYDCTQALA